MAYQIIVDSTVDLPPHMAEEWGLVVIPFIYNFGGKEYYNYLDYRQQSIKDYYDGLRKGVLSSTSQITAYRYMECWEPFLKEGKDVFFMSLSSGLSKSFDQSEIAIEELKAQYPEREIITIDTKSASLAQGALAYYAYKAQKEGKTIHELAEYIRSLVPTLQHWAMADDLYHLRRGGRVSGAAAFVGSMLSVKPILTMLDDGRLVPVQKVRGRNKAVKYFVDQMANQGIDTTNQVIVIAHSDAPELAAQLEAAITEKFGKCEFIINHLGPVIGAHTGPGTIAMGFAGAVRPTSQR